MLFVHANIDYNSTNSFIGENSKQRKVLRYHMSIELKAGTVNQVVKGTTLFTHDESIEYICLILKGRVVVKSKGTMTILVPGCFIGINDLFIGRYLSDYIALDELAIYTFEAEGAQTINTIVGTNKDYGGLMVYSLCNYMKNLNDIKSTLLEQTSLLYTFINSQYRLYIEIGKKLGITTITVPKVDELLEFNQEYSVDEKKLSVYLESCRVPAEVQKSYYSYTSALAVHHTEEISALIAEITIECSELADYIEELTYILMNDGEQSLFKYQAILAIKLGQAGKYSKELMDSIDDTVDYINKIENIFHEKIGRTLQIDRKKMEQLYYVLLTGKDDKEVQAEEDLPLSIVGVNELKGALQQILGYSTLEKDVLLSFANNIEYFVSITDRLAMDDKTREVKRNITKTFYSLYENIFLLSYGKQTVPKVIDLFLNFGFIDERLLTKEQLLSLCQLEISQKESRCNIYTVREWLTLVLEGKKEPSKTEFDMEYVEALRTARRRGEITEEEEIRRNNDCQEKLKFEIKNMFSYNNKIVNGQLSTFVPVLYQDIFISTIERAYLSSKRVEESFFKVLAIDNSAFCREVLYYDKEKRINKEYIIKEVHPDIILLPTVGVNGSMWQEVSGKRRDNPGRFIFPIFFEANFDDLMVRMFGRFQWELCRFLQGSAWNNIKEKSLTSEYMDYLQFYRKNSELSEERKEKLKLQIQKNRNNSREVFVSDYEAWINGEALGAIKLNKYVREILATYCPFSKGIRERIKMQPLFEGAMARFNRNRAKKIHELELRYHALQKDGVELTEELIQTLKFYKEQ